MGNGRSFGRNKSGTPRRKRQYDYTNAIAFEDAKIKRRIVGRARSEGHELDATQIGIAVLLVRKHGTKVKDAIAEVLATAIPVHDEDGKLIGHNFVGMPRTDIVPQPGETITISGDQEPALMMRGDGKSIDDGSPI